MADIQLGRLEQVDLRQTWQSEPADFTPWLAQPGNLQLLGDTIGLELETEGIEQAVGPYSADILARDLATGRYVVIENQLEKTDHTHLGQLLTYAAGFDATTIVWIARRFADEHRASLDWLNALVGDHLNIFGLEIELWRIGDSPVAPKFNIVAQPNEWSSTTARVQQDRVLAVIPSTQLEFWTEFKAFLEERSGNPKPTKPYPQHWMDMAIGRSEFHVSAIASTWDSEAGTQGNELRAEFVMVGDATEERYEQLLQVRTEIEAVFGEPLIWHSNEGVKMKRAYIRRQFDWMPVEAWPEAHLWLAEKLEALDRTFRQRIKALP